MIQVQNISLSFGKQLVFDHVSCIIQSHQRVGLVGANGTGKSTLLKAITHQQVLDEGIITISNSCKVAYMPQEVVMVSCKTVFEEALTTFQEFYRVRDLMPSLEQKLLNNPTVEEVETYAQAQQTLKGYQPEMIYQETRAVLEGLGFTEALQQKTVNTLSVGWKMRLVLAKLLLQKADFYLFDEPTNHLDIVAKDWFLSFLKNSKCGFLLVCHERYFLDKLCTDILELELGKATWYKGNYTAYAQQKEFARAALERAYEQQTREIAQKMATIERFRASATKAKMAQSMMKEVEAIERIVLPPSPKTIRFSVGETIRPGKIVLSVKNVRHDFGSNILFDHVSCEIERGEKVALIAPNGTGKTTLFNLIAGILKLQHGTVTLGHNVQHALFAQDQQAVLPPQKTIFEYVSSCCPKRTEQEIRSWLGAFLFSNDTIHKKLGVLSGGERNRVSMIVVLLQGANLLMLDEPTNHLDMQSKEILLTALKQFTGTIFFVSHDHDFINQLATRILELTPHGIESYQGNYDDYLYQKQHRISTGVPAPQKNSLVEPKAVEKPSAIDNKQQFEMRKQIKKLEGMIEKLEADIKRLEPLFANVEYGSTQYKAHETKLQSLRENLEKSLREWEELQEKIF